MGQKQLVQLLQYILVWVLIWLFVVFVLEESFVDFLLKYRLYFLIVSVSYFYYYSIQYDPDKKSKLIRNVIIYGNLYLFAHVFFRPLLNISHELFLLLGLIILGIWWTTRLNTRWKYALQIVGVIVSFFILISGMFYLYPEEPDIDGFIKSRKNTISVVGVDENISKRDAYIQIVNSKGSMDFEIDPDFGQILLETSRISYPSLKKERIEKIYIMTSYGDVVRIYPQSEVQLQFDKDVLKKIFNQNGKIGYLSGMFDSAVEIEGNMVDLQSEQLDRIQSIQDEYKYDMIAYLKNQISENNMSLANNTIMYNIDGKIIKLLAKMFPASFSKNLDNYNKFQNYFELIESDKIGLDKYSMDQEDGGSVSWMWKSLINNMKGGKGNTYILY